MTFYLGKTSQVGKPSPDFSSQIRSGTVSTIAFSGSEVRGNMNIIFPAPFLKNAIARFFDDEEDQTPSIELDVSGELCNQILGEIKKNCRLHDLEISLTLPKIFHYTDCSGYQIPSEPILSVPIWFEGAQCSTEFFFEKIENTDQKSYQHKIV